MKKYIIGFVVIVILIAVGSLVRNNWSVVGTLGWEVLHTDAHYMDTSLRQYMSVADIQQTYICR